MLLGANQGKPVGVVPLPGEATAAAEAGDFDVQVGGAQAVVLRAMLSPMNSCDNCTRAFSCARLQPRCAACIRLACWTAAARPFFLRPAGLPLRRRARAAAAAAGGEHRLA